MKNRPNTLNLECLEQRLLLSANAIDADEQLFIYLLNKARSDPEAYEIDAALSVNLEGISAQPPLAVNTLLHNSAFFHAEEMAENDYFSHQSAVTGDWPNKMAIDAGYNLPFGSTPNNIESLAAGFGNPPEGVSPTDAPKALQLLIEDLGVNPPGHRQHLLAMSSFWEQHREIGTGFANNDSATFRNYWSIHTAYVNTTDLFLTGVVYDDKNDNGVYDLNEGLADVTVTTDQGGSVQTNSAGGWSIAVTSGTYIVSASGGNYTGIGSAVAIVSDANVEADFISGAVQGVIDFGLDTGSSLPKVSLAATDANGAELGQETGTFTFTRTGDTTNAMTVNFVISGSATSGDDYMTIADTIQIEAGQNEATVTITPVDDDDIEGQETVTLTLLASLEYQFGNTITDTVNIADDEGAIVIFGDGAAKSVTYTDPDGTLGSLSAKSATGTVVFTGNNVIITPTSKGITVTADGGALISQIILENTSSASSLAFKAKGGTDNKIDVGDIIINGSAKDIKGKQVNLTGDLVVTGGLKKLEFADVADPHLITIGVSNLPGATVSIKLANVTDLSINSGMAIKSLAVFNWQDTGQDDLITAPWLGKLTSKQDFGASLNLTDDSVKKTLGSVKVKQTITQGAWNVTGNGGKTARGKSRRNSRSIKKRLFSACSTSNNIFGENRLT